MVSGVIDSGSGYVRRTGSCICGTDGESTYNVEDDEAESSASDVDDTPRKGVGCEAAWPRWRERMLWLMCDSEKGRCGSGSGVAYSATVSQIAVVISLREVYGKQTLRMAL